jgi:hypothetical protein
VCFIVCRNKCPKCGNLVTFRHGDFDANTFYCAACSGWFAVSPTPSASVANDAGIHSSVNHSVHEIKDPPVHSMFSSTRDNPSRLHQTSESNIIMTHIPDDAIYQDSASNRKLGGGNARPLVGNSIGGGSGGNHDSAPIDDPISVLKRIPTPREILRGLNAYVIGQRNVKVALAVGVYNHYKRLFVAETENAMELIKAEARSTTTPATAGVASSSMTIHHQHFHGPSSHTLSTISTKYGSSSSSSSSSPRVSQRPTTTSSAVSLMDLQLGQFGTSIVSQNSDEALLTAAAGTSPASKTSTNKGSTTGDAYCEANISNTEDVNSINDRDFVREVEECKIDKSNIMLLGPTGSGKTLLVRTLARIIDVPLVVTDATCLTQAGYVGEDVESVLFKLYLESGQDIERCQRGIVYIDEVDKIRKSGGNLSISRDVSGEGVQHALLKIVEGNEINVPKVGKR